jgi:CubicO group peptidase (beta-lactamase class C family)
MRNVFRNATMLFTIPVFFFLLNCSGQKTVAIDERIKNVENGLVKYKFDKNFTVGMLIDSRRIDTLPKLNIYDRMKDYKIPGVSIAVINDFKVDWAKGYGVMKEGTDKKVTTETMFQSGSSSKVLMAIIILRFAEEGKLDLDSDINKYLKSWKMPEHPSGIKVTLRMLLTHQSGINRPGDGFDCEPGSNPTLVQWLKGEKPVLNDPVKFDTIPGTKHSYSNFGYLVMQFLLEDYFETSYTELVKKYIFEPLKLNSSLIEYPFPARFAGRVIWPHNENGEPADYEGLSSSALAQAGMVSTPGDWAKIVCELMLANKGKSDKILSQESAKLMFSTELKLNPSEFEGLSGQGLGVFLYGKGEKEYFVHQGHNNPGANCIIIGSTSSGKGIVIMTNGMRGIPLACQILSSVSKEYDWDEGK